MNGHVQLRLSGDLGDITMVLAELLASKQFHLAVNETPYPNRRGLGVRVYVDLATPTFQQDRPPHQPFDSEDGDQP